MNAGWFADLAEEEPDAAALAALSDPPDDAFVPPGAEFAWRAFCRLSAERPSSLSGYALPQGGVVLTPSPGRIRFAALDHWARRQRLGAGAFELLVALVERLDDVFLELHAERIRDQMPAR